MSKLNHIKNYYLENKLFKKRLFLSGIIIICLLAVLIVRLGYLQLHSHVLYAGLAAHNKLVLLPIEPNRGLIYDRNGVLVATNTPIFGLSIIPDQVADLDETIDALKEIIDITPENIRQFYKFLNQRKHFDHVTLKYKLTQDETDKFYAEQYRFPGVTIDVNMIRSYPLGKTMASVLGYVGRIDVQDLKKINFASYGVNSFIGKTGAEKYFEQTLHGKVGNQQVEIDASSHVVRALNTISPVSGDNLYLTIDSKLQQVAMEALGQEHGSVVVVDPKNGEVFAMVSNPSFDPNLFTLGIDPQAFKKLQNTPGQPMYNRAVSGRFPLASTIKPYIALEGLDSGSITPDYSIYDPGHFKLPNSSHVYLDWVHTGHGTVNVTKAIIVSCDTFFYTLATKLGINKIDNILDLFGFGKKTGIESSEEVTGIVASPKWKKQHRGKSWYPGDTVISGIGQGFMSATPVQLAAAVATLAERGARFKLHLLLKREVPGGQIISTLPELTSSIVLKSKKYWDIVINAMHNVVQGINGTARDRFGEDVGYTVAGKTGGAQLFHHNENATAADEARMPKKLRNHSLFIAFAPVVNPRVAIAVVVENSTVAPAVARKVLDYYLSSQPDFVIKKKIKKEVRTEVEDQTQDQESEQTQNQEQDQEANRTEQRNDFDREED